MLTDLTLKEFINEVDSEKPAPGGGSVSALAGVISVSLVRMVGKLTFGKKKYLGYSDETKQEFESRINLFETYKNSFYDFINQDTEAFNQMMIAYKMPKSNEAEIDERNTKIQLATQEGIRVPLEVASLGVHVLESLPFFIKYGNQTALSDLGVALLMISSAIEGAILNVEINLPGITNDTLKETYLSRVNEIMSKMESIKSEWLPYIHTKCVK